MPQTSEPDDQRAAASPAEALDVLVRFAALMVQVGNTAVRTREWIDSIAPRLGFEVVSVVGSLDSVTISGRRRGEWLTAMRGLGPPGINVSRLAQLEQLAKILPSESPPAELAKDPAKIKSAHLQCSFAPL